MFYVGQKVVCVDNRSNPGCSWHEEKPPEVGAIYTITNIFQGRFNGETAFHLAEIKRSRRACEQWGYNLGYGAHRFRPVVERTTDISVFTEILRKASKKKPAPVRAE